MHWDHLFNDLEGQLASEWEAERAALDAESERLRISRLDLRSRLRVLCDATATVVLDLADGQRLTVRLDSLGLDWVAAESVEQPGASAARTVSIIPLTAIAGVSMDHGMLLSSLEDRDAEPSLRERMTLGFVLRDLARRRVPVHLALHNGTHLHGTIDRAGADHLDLATHEAGEVRRVGAVTGLRIVPFAALVRVRAAGLDARLP